jgi:tRNA A37 N6-isopentenylltransferase MiaA
MRRLALAAALLASFWMGACSSAPPPAARDAALPPWYAQTIDQLTELNRRADSAFQSGKSDDAAAIIKEAQSLAARLLSVPRPSLAAAEAASDVDDLYGRMLLANRHYAWAQMFFQKNRSRWKNWTPQTPETARRRQQAESAIADCQRHLTD